MLRLALVQRMILPSFENGILYGAGIAFKRRILPARTVLSERARDVIRGARRRIISFSMNLAYQDRQNNANIQNIHYNSTKPNFRLIPPNRSLVRSFFHCIAKK